MCSEGVDSKKKKIKHINIYIHTYSLISAAYPKVQQVHVGAVPVKWVKHRSEERSCSLCRDVCLCGAAKYKNVLNAIMEDGEAKVLGLRRSKPLFFFFFLVGRELFLFKTAPQKTSSEPCHIPI